MCSKYRPSRWEFRLTEKDEVSDDSGLATYEDYLLVRAPSQQSHTVIYPQTL